MDQHSSLHLSTATLVIDFQCYSPGNHALAEKLPIKHMLPPNFNGFNVVKSAHDNFMDFFFDQEMCPVYRFNKIPSSTISAKGPLLHLMNGFQPNTLHLQFVDTTSTRSTL
uniref:Uncharacterized protein n=1 Tax=Spongospora subterranea TaxID=70186 RepID=A0A0H5QZ31_9EUKA|eukprot:CRZ06946.1 hypothetical protein [Spongospora subterranea]